MTAPGSNKELLRIANPVVGRREQELVNEALSTGWISSQGKFVAEFERGFSAYCGVQQGVAVANGTVALHLALAALKIGPGDEIVVPTLTHIAVATAATLVGAKMVLIDSDRGTWGMDASKLAAAITPKTKAIVAVHLYGHPVDMDPIIALGKQRGIAVIEDAAEAHGALYKGRRAGSLSDIASFSFYANKLITTGEGGMLVCNDEKLAERSRKLRDQAYEPGRKFVHAELGFNYRLTNVQAAIGCAQLEKADEFLKTRRSNAAAYDDRLRDIPGVTLPPEQEWARSSYWMYSIVVDKPFPLDRDELMKQLFDEGIETRPLFYPIHWQPLYKPQFAGAAFPVAEHLAEHGLNLPSGNELTTADVERVAGAIRRIAGR